MRVGIIANSLDTGNPDRAGGFVHVVETAKRWTGVEIVVMGPRSAEAAFRRHLSIEHYIAVRDWGESISASSMIFRSAEALARVRELRRKCDVTMAISHSIADVLPALCFGRKRSIVQYWHFIGNPLRRNGSLTRNMLAYANELVGRCLAHQCRGAICGSTVIAREMNAVGKRFVHVTTNGVTRRLSASPPDRAGTIYVGRLHPTKGVEDLIKAWAAVNRDLPEERLTIVGAAHPEYLVVLRRSIEALGLSRVVDVRTDADDPTKFALLSSARLFAFASHEEGWGIALAEAMAFGLPCVTYDLPAFQEIFPVGRVWCPVKNVDAFANQVIALLRDDQRRASIGEEALRLSQTFTWERAASIEFTALSEVAEG